MNAILTLAITALISSVLILLNKRASLNIRPLLKLMVIVYCLIGFVRYFLSDSFVENVLDGADMFESLLRTFYHISYATLPMAVFFDRRIFRNIALCFNLPMGIIAAIVFDRTFAYFLASGGGGYYINETVRLVIYMAELVLATVIPLVLCVSEGHAIRLKSPREWMTTVLAFLAVSWMMMPSYIPQSTVGFTSLSADTYGNMHLAWIGYIAVECIIICAIFRKCAMDEKHELCIFLTIAQMYHTMSIFLRGFTYSRIPLQLCCIAAFLYFIAVVTKNRKLFDFCYVSNMIGAFIAIAIAAFSPEALCFWNVHYMQEHTFVVVVPIVAYALGLFPRMERTAPRHIITIFTIYFLFCLIGGGLINTFTSDGGEYVVNYFYMFNHTVAVNYVSFAGFTGAIELIIAGVKYYPLLIGFIYVVFVTLCMLFFWGNRAIYAVKDVMSGVRRQKPNLAEYTSAIRRL